MGWSKDVVIIGGCGHAGMPLAIAFAHRGLRVGIYDLSESAVKQVNAARLPFDEPRAPEPLAPSTSTSTQTLRPYPVRSPTALGISSMGSSWCCGAPSFLV